MKFETSKQLDDWMLKHQEKCKTRAFDGAQFSIEFIPTGIIEAQTAKCMCCKEEKTVYVD